MVLSTFEQPGHIVYFSKRSHLSQLAWKPKQSLINRPVTYHNYQFLQESTILQKQLSTLILNNNEYYNYC